jgi:MYXO-CTERM domain-containing protein
MPETVNTVIGYAWPGEAPWLLGMVLVLGALLWRVRREDHRGMVEEITQVLAARRTALDAVQQGLARVEVERTDRDRLELLDRVRRFFGIAS